MSKYIGLIACVIYLTFASIIVASLQEPQHIIIGSKPTIEADIDIGHIPPGGWADDDGYGGPFSPGRSWGGGGGGGRIGGVISPVTTPNVGGTLSTFWNMLTFQIDNVPPLFTIFLIWPVTLYMAVVLAEIIAKFAGIVAKAILGV